MLSRIKRGTLIAIAAMGLVCVPAVTSAHSAAPALAANALSSDDGMRCGQRLVNVGDTKGAVVDKCGRPGHEESRWEQRVEPDGRTSWVRVDDWFYKLSSSQFRRVVTFEQALVTQIRAMS